jgi:hypothetical protein
MRLCRLCGGPALSQRHTYCRRCRQVVDDRKRVQARERSRQRRATATPVERQRYGVEHRRRRRQLEPLVAAGSISCVRCGLAILAGQEWDLDHVNGAGGPTSPAHATCNRREGALAPPKRAANSYPKPVQRSSRDW